MAEPVDSPQVFLYRVLYYLLFLAISYSQPFNINAMYDEKAISTIKEIRLSIVDKNVTIKIFNLPFAFISRVI